MIPVKLKRILFKKSISGSQPSGLVTNGVTEAPSVRVELQGKPMKVIHDNTSTITR